MPDRRCAPNTRRSPGRLSRGFMPDGVRRFDAEVLCIDGRVPLLELHPIVAYVHHHVVALAEIALEHPQSQRVEYEALNRALERPSPVHWIVPLRDQERFGGVAELDLDLP